MTNKMLTKTDAATPGKPTVYFWSVLLGNLLAIAVAVFVLILSHGEIERAARKTTDNVTTLIGLDIEHEYQKIDLALGDIAAEYPTFGSEEISALARWRQRVGWDQRNRSILRIADATGEIQYSNEPLGDMEDSIAAKDFFIRLSQESDPGLMRLPPVIGSVSKKNTFFLARRLTEKSGNFAGIVMASIPLEHFYQHLSHLSLGKDELVLVTDTEKRLLIHYPRSASGPGGEQARLAMIDERISGDSLGRFDLKDDRGVDRMFSFRHSADYGFTVSTGVSRSAVFSEWRTVAAAISLLISVLILGTAFFALRLRRSWQSSLTSQEVLREQEQRLIESQRIARLGHFSIDMRSETWEVSETLAEICGIDADFPRNRAGWQKLIPADDRIALLGEIRHEVIGKGKALDIMVRLQRLDGDMRWVHIRARMERHGKARQPIIFGSVQDVSEQRKVLGTLQQSEARFQAFFDSAMIGMAITSPATGWIKVNRALCEILGYPKEELVTKTWTELTHPEDLAADLAEFNRVLAGEIDGYSLDKRFLRPDGTIIDASIAARAVRKSDGSIDFFSASIQNITAQKGAQKALNETKGLLEAAGQAGKFGGWSIDLPSMAVSWTDETYRIHEIEPGTPISLQEILSFVVAESRDSLQSALDCCINEGLSWDMELELITRSGSRIWTRMIGQAAHSGEQITRIFGALININTQRVIAGALIESERRLRLLAQHTAAEVFELHPDGTIVFANRISAGMTQEQVVGTSVLNWFPTGHAATMASALEKAISQQKEQRLDYDILTPAGEPRSYEACLIPVILERQVSSVVLTATDITDRKRFERQLLNSRELLRQFLDHFPGTAYVKDESLRVRMASAGFKTQLGLDPRDMIGRVNEELFPGALGEKISADDRRILASEKTETLIEEMNGRTFETTKFVVWQDKRRLIGGITLDVSTRLRNSQRTQALLELNELSGSLPEREYLRAGLQVAETLTNSKIGFLHFVNEDQETIELVTWTEGALRGCQAAYDNHYPISQAGIWANCFRERAPVIFNDYANFAARRGLPAGHATLDRLISVPVIEGEMVRMMMGIGNKSTDYDDFDLRTVQLIGNDLWRVVRRLRAEQALKDRLAELTTLNQKLEQAQNQLLQSDKMATIGQLAAGVAHELNNPIGFIQSNLGTLNGYVDDLLTVLEDCESCAALCPDSARYEAFSANKEARDIAFLKDDIKQLLNESKDGADRVRRIVQNLKDFSHVSEEEWLWTDLHQGLDSTLNLVWNEIKYKAEVDKQYGHLPEVFCVASQLNQVFMNMLVNAAQAIETKGRITLRTGTIDGEKPEEAKVWIEIQDTGKGIPAENRARIFDPFFTTKPVGKGTGLGLSLAWSIIQKHHGSVEVDSVVGQGTTFRITLPVNGNPEINTSKS